MISYNSKFINIATICFIVYFVYSARKHEPRFLLDLQDGFHHSGQIANHTVIVDPQKPDSQKTIIERVLSVIYKDKIERAVKVVSNDARNLYGDKVIYLFEQHYEGEAVNTPVELEYIMGVTQGPDYLWEKLSNASVGDKFNFEIRELEKTKKIYIEVKAIKKSTLVK